MTCTDLALLGRLTLHLRPGHVAHQARFAPAGMPASFPEAGHRGSSWTGLSAAVRWSDAFRPMDARTAGRNCQDYALAR